MSGPNGEGLPTHILITDELVQRALEAALDAGADRWTDEREIRAALSAVAPELWQAGYDAGQKMRPGVVNCPECARNDTVSRRTDGKLACAWCGWMSPPPLVGPVNTTHQHNDPPRPAPEPFA